MPDADGYPTEEEWPWETCPYCKGTGFKDGDPGGPTDVPEDCPHCAGSNGSFGRRLKKGWVLDPVHGARWVGPGPNPMGPDHG